MEEKLVKAADEWLDEIGFESSSHNKVRFRCVVLSQAVMPGSHETEILPGARKAADILGLSFEEAGETYPRFHFGKAEVRYYFRHRSNKVGKNHTTDELTPFCFSHNRAGEAEAAEQCDLKCSYGFKFRGQPAQELIKSRLNR